MEKVVIKTKLIEFISYAIEIIKLLLNFKKYSLIISGLFFLIGTSNMRNHRIIAKIVFLFPLIISVVTTILR